MDHVYMLPREFDKHLLSIQLLMDSPLAVRLNQKLTFVGRHWKALGSKNQLCRFLIILYCIKVVRSKFLQ